MLIELGHQIVGDDDTASADMLIALHARKSAPRVRRFASAAPGRPIVVVLTGTDLYVDLPRGDKAVLEVLSLADRLVVLQPHAIEVLPSHFASKARVILQSVIAPTRAARPRVRTFDVCVVGHLRHVKDPMRAAMASRKLPADSRIAVLQAGDALERRFEVAAAKEMERNPRYTWLGGISRARSRRLIARSRALIVSSRAEGGAHVVSEALVAGTPVLATRISGNIGMLGEDYPALFEVGDTAALTALMLRFENEPTFRDRLDLWCRLLAPAYTPDRERFALRARVAALA